MFMYGVRRVVVLGMVGAIGAVPAACLFAPIDYSGIYNQGGGGCSGAEGCSGPAECKTVSCLGETCQSTNAPTDKLISQIEHDCSKRRCDGNGNVEVIPDPDDIPANDNNACTLEDCDDATPVNVPAGSPCSNGVCDGQGRCATCDDGTRNGNETDIDCGGPDCPHCDGELCSGDPAGCQSAHCVDGVCCSTACDKKCEACVVSLTGAPSGTCAPLVLGKPDGNACTGLGGCGVNNLCACEDGVKNQTEVGVDCGGICGGGCGEGTSCTQDFECTSGACSSGVCCDKSCDGHCERCDSPGQVGHCVAVPPMSQGGCGPLQACDSNGACRKTNGETCAGKAECVSGLCVDGLCCDAACDGLCRSCRSAVKQQGEDGVCGFIKSGADPEGECIKSCDGQGSCIP